MGEYPIPEVVKEEFIEEKRKAKRTSELFQSPIISRVEFPVNDYISPEMNTVRGGSIESLHGVSFIKDVIPNKIRQLRENGQKRNLQILDAGSGVGVYNDQLRFYFPDGVDVFGTTFNNRKREKKEVLDTIQTEEGVGGVLVLELLSDREKKKQIVREVSRPKFNRKDRIRESVLELSGKSKFDLVIDTFGEGYYAMATDDDRDDDEYTNFYRYLEKVLSILNSGGDFYMASAGDIENRVFKDHRDGSIKKGNRFADFFISHISEFESKYGVKVYFEGSLTIEKLRELLDIDSSKYLDSRILTSYIRSYLKNAVGTNPIVGKIRKMFESGCSLRRMRFHKV